MTEGLGGIRDLFQKLSTKCHRGFYGFFNFCGGSPESFAGFQVCTGSFDVCLVDDSSAVNYQVTLLTQVP